MTEIDKEKLKKILSPLSYQVTQENGTERPFNNAFDDFSEKGFYVDIVSDEPFFTSLNKYNSGRSWPAFIKPIEESSLNKEYDTSYGMNRTEIRSSKTDSHLEHVFNDDPRNKGGLRYCINSSALRFISFKKLAKEGYADYIHYFDEE